MLVSKRFDKFGVRLGIMIAVGFTVWTIDSGIQAQTGGRTFYVDVKNASCADKSGNGSESKPYCSVSYASTVAVPGDVFLVKAGRYSNGPATFTKSGSSAAPITYKAIGDVVLGFFDDVADEEFKATQYPNVYSIARRPIARRGYRVYQTYFDPILVDDPGNASVFTMRQEDGPLALSLVTDYAILSKIEGTWLFDATTDTVYIHPFNNRVPTTARTDFVFGHAGDTLVVAPSVQFNIFDGFRLTYSGGSSLRVFGSRNRFVNLRFQGSPWTLGGGNNYAENISISHVIGRGETWEWHTGGSGTALGIGGADQKLRNLHIYHNWNSSISSETAQGLVIEGLRMHGAPNHCGTGGKGVTFRNVVLYNCQDYFYFHETNDMVIEHAVVPGGIMLQAINGPIGPVTVRNSILSGTWAYNLSVSKAITCAWESGSVLEHNIISSTATIRHCEDHKAYPIAEYIGKCQSGALTNCMTVRGNIQVSDFKTVIRDGMWNAALGDKWDVSLVPSSAAIDRGIPSGTTTDILGVARPFGSAPDIGAHEFCARGCPTSFPTDTPALLPRTSSAPSNLRILQ